ncbi:MAG: DUF1566 domain-containing protein [Bacteroidales bacterium]|nr:DUF1566 domain-containing protein [Bacteroidales bacterium]
MKKLISFIGLAAVVLLGFTSCDKEPKPKFTTNLNTGHQYVGSLYGRKGIVEDPEDAQGIVFAVSPDEKTAYLVAFTDLMEVNTVPTTGFNWGYDCFATPTAWSNNIFETGAKDKDGEKNTERIIAADTMKGGTAAQNCREYFKRNYQATVENQETFDEYLKWEDTKGDWYLPSMEELAALMKVRDKINQKYLQGAPASDVANKIYFQAIGGEMNFAYWSSTEHNRQLAWYDLPASNNDNAVPKTWANEKGNGKIYVRPIRKVAL